MNTRQKIRNFLVLLCIVETRVVDAFQQSSVSGMAVAVVHTSHREGWARSRYIVPSVQNLHRQKTPSSRCLRKSSFPDRREYTSLQMDQWDGDDMRWTSRIRRRFSRRQMLLDTAIKSKTKISLIALQILIYCYQVITTVVYCKRKFPSYWPDHAMEIIVDSIWDSASITGPLTTTFGFSAVFSKARQSYRYITSGLFHNSLPHLFIDIFVLARQPSWLASGLGAPLYLTCFFGSIIAGNLGHLMNSSDRIFDPNIYLGANGGICGLFGLMFVCLTRMARANPSRTGGGTAGQLAQGVAAMAVLAFLMDNVSMATNVGGFFGGVIIGILCGPRYTKDYAMRRKNSIGYDSVSYEYRSAMGFGITPTRTGLVPLKVLYYSLLAVTVAVPKYRNIPVAIIKGFMGAL